MNRISVKLLIMLLFCFVSGSMSKEKANPIKIVCIGDSITFGYLVKIREQNSYPAILQKKLGSKYKVFNFGVPSKTILKSNGKSIQPYVDTSEYKKAIKAKADIILLMLGANDSKPNNWSRGKEQFSNDFQNLIKPLKTSETLVYWCIPSAIQENLEPMAKNLDEIIEQERRIAQKLGLVTIDLHKPTKNKPYLFVDGLHPNKKGCELIAEIILEKIKNK